jgi:hypothetical protein
MINYFTQVSENIACVAAITEKGQPARNPMLCRLLVLSEDEKSNWFKMKNMLIYAKIHTNTADVLLRGVSLSFASIKGHDLRFNNKGIYELGSRSSRDIDCGVFVGFSLFSCLLAAPLSQACSFSSIHRRVDDKYIFSS